MTPTPQDSQGDARSKRHGSRPSRAKQRSWSGEPTVQWSYQSCIVDPMHVMLLEGMRPARAWVQRCCCILHEGNAIVRRRRTSRESSETRTSCFLASKLFWQGQGSDMSLLKHGGWHCQHMEPADSRASLQTRCHILSPMESVDPSAGAQMRIDRYLIGSRENQQKQMSRVGAMGFTAAVTHWVFQILVQRGTMH